MVPVESLSIQQYNTINIIFNSNGIVGLTNIATQSNNITKLIMKQGSIK